MEGRSDLERLLGDRALVNAYFREALVDFGRRSPVEHKNQHFSPGIIASIDQENCLRDNDAGFAGAGAGYDQRVGMLVADCLRLIAI